MEKSVLGLVFLAFLVHLCSIHAATDFTKCANKLDCGVVRLQQYFCIARCISFVRDEAPSALTNNGTCPAVNWWWRPTTTTTTPPTTVPVATGPCSNLKGFDKCCRKQPYDELFPDDDDCFDDSLVARAEYKRLTKDTELFNYVSPSGVLQLNNVPDSSYYYYDCLFKNKKLYDDGDLNSKRLTSFLKKNSDESYSDTIDDQVPQCIKFAKKTPRYDEKVRIFANNTKTIRVYQSPYVFNVCIRRGIFTQCKPQRSDDCSGFIDNITNCVITLPNS